MHISIYIGSKPVHLCDAAHPMLKEKQGNKDVIFINELSARSITDLLSRMKQGDIKEGIMAHPNWEKLKKAFFKQFTVITACGGIVQNVEKELLFIYRRGKWDLPKGKMEIGELPETCAAREVEEETGIGQLVLKEKIGTTYHTYEENGKQILKENHWFYFTTKSHQQPVPQSEEEITKAKWIPTRHIKEPMDNTYPAIQDILHTFFDKP
ncbi:MAG: NUDIX domain-containing protein [Ferruginibacter sp.]|nr:NUDIX domain-containing protein [Ferruginibacter sp.]